MGVYGIVRDGDDDDDDPMPNVTIELKGDEEGYEGPYYVTTGSDGKYTYVFGEYGDVGRVEFRAKIIGPDVKTDDRPRWKTTGDCHEDDALQVMRIDWAKTR